MGLDTSFNCWVYELQYLERRAGGYKIETKTEVPDINWEGDNLWGNWDPDPEDVLIAHYDCDGISIVSL